MVDEHDDSETERIGTGKANRRGAARLAAVQALYQMDIAGTGSNEILAQFESHWIGREVEGNKYLPAEAAFFREIVNGVVREQREPRPIDRRRAGADLAAQAHRGHPACSAARGRLRARASQRRAGGASWSPNMSMSPMHSWTAREPGMVNAVLDQLARTFSRR